MGHLSSPLVLPLGSTPGEASGPAIPQVNTELFGANVATQWTFVGAGGLAPSIPWENGFSPATCQALAATDYAFGSTCALYTTTSIPAQATDRINCISCYIKVPGAGVVSPQCRLEFRITAGAILSIDVDPRTGVLIAKTPGVLNPQVQRIVLPLFVNIENVSIYRISFSFDGGGAATGIPRFYPRTDGVAAGTTVFGGTQLEWMVSIPSPFITPNAAAAGIRLAGQTPRQTTTPNLEHKFLGAGLSPYNVDASADQDTWLECAIAAGNTINLPQVLAFDMPTGSRLLVTQAPAAIGGITTINAGANKIIAPGGITGTFTTVTFPSADFPNVTQMMLIKTAVLNQWEIIATSAGGSAGGLFLQAGAGAVPRTFQNKDREHVTILDYNATANGIAIDTASIQDALNYGYALDAINYNQSVTGALNVPATVRRIDGQNFKQEAIGSNILNVANATNLSIANSDFTGIGGSAVPQTVNTGIDVSTSTNVRVSGGYFLDLRYEAVAFTDCADCSIIGIQGRNLGAGIRLTGSVDISVSNIILTSEQGTGALSTGIALDSTSADIGGAYCQSVNLSNIVVKGYPASQALLIHAGVNITINGATFDDVLAGIAIGGVVAGDILQRIKISDFVYLGTNTVPGYAATVNYGALLAGFGPTVPAVDVSLTNFAINNANNIMQDINEAGLRCSNTSNLVVSNGQISDCVANGINLYSLNSNVNISDVDISNVIAAAGHSDGIFINAGAAVTANVTGKIKNISINGATLGVRLGQSGTSAVQISGVGTLATVVLPPVAAGAFVVGTIYKIVSVGTTDFTLIGAANNNVGTLFTATGAGAGTGTATPAHGLLTGQWIRTSGVTFVAPADAYYNGAFQITVTDACTFTYTMGAAITTAAAPGAPVIRPTYDGLFFDNISFSNVTTQFSNTAFAVIEQRRSYVTGDSAPWIHGTKTMDSVTNGTAININGLRGGQLGQVITFAFTDANTTFKRGAAFKLQASADFVSAADATLTLVCVDDTTTFGVWWEICRRTTGYGPNG